MLLFAGCSHWPFSYPVHIIVPRLWGPRLMVHIRTAPDRGKTRYRVHDDPGSGQAKPSQQSGKAQRSTAKSKSNSNSLGPRFRGQRPSWARVGVDPATIACAMYASVRLGQDTIPFLDSLLGFRFPGKEGRGILVLYSALLLPTMACTYP